MGPLSPSHHGAGVELEHDVLQESHEGQRVLLQHLQALELPVLLLGGLGEKGGGQDLIGKGKRPQKRPPPQKTHGFDVVLEVLVLGTDDGSGRGAAGTGAGGLGGEFWGEFWGALSPPEPFQEHPQDDLDPPPRPQNHPKTP